MTPLEPLDPERFAQVERLFHELAELDQPARQERLATLEGSDPELAAELRELLRAETESDDAVAGLELLVRGEEGTRSATLALGDEASLGESTTDVAEEDRDRSEGVVGAYTLLRRLGDLKTELT